MILRASAAFTERFKCQLSHEGERLPQERRLDAWSCHFVRIGRKPLVVAMNDATLYTLIFPVTGVKGFPELWLRMLGRIAEVWMKHGAEFDPHNQSVIVLPRTNRSLIGSMNDAVAMIRFYDDLAKVECVELDLADMESRSNMAPYKALGYEHPDRLLARMLGGGKSEQ
jgi:hypothetical protein